MKQISASTASDGGAERRLGTIMLAMTMLPGAGGATGAMAAVAGAGNGQERVRPMTPDDAAAVLDIFQQGLDGGNASFETRAPDWAGFDAGHLAEHRFVAVDAALGAVLGWVAATAVSSRCVYAGVVEHSVYVAGSARRRGVGRLLLAALIESTEAAGIWTIQSGVFPENVGSLALHRACGFRVVGTRERIAVHHGRWRDVVLLERRSPVIG